MLMLLAADFSSAGAASVSSISLSLPSIYAIFAG